MHIQDNVLFIDDYVYEIPKSAEDKDVSVYFVEEGFRVDFAHEILVGQDPNTEAREGFTFLGSVRCPADPAMMLERRKKEISAKLIEKTNSLGVILKSGYSDLEEKSWIAQESEARALMAVPTPTIDALCAARNCTRDYLARKIIENADNARNAGMFILSWQQEMEEKIKKMALEEFSSVWDEISNK